MKIIVHTSDNPRIIVGKARNMQMIVEYQGSASNSNIIRCTETEFNALSSLDSKTIYAVTDNSDNLLYVYIGYDKLSLESETITKFGWVVNVSSVGYDTLYFFKDQSTANSWLQSPTAANAPLASTTVSNVGNTINLGKPQSGYYTLTTAIAAVPSASRKGGLCITFMVADGAWRTYRYKPATTTGWSTESNWEDTTSEIEEMLEELDDKKADKTGLHHSLGSGTSDGLAGTDVVDAEYTLRCTGDKMSNLGTGAAAIDTVKGNTLVWNQLVENGNFTSGTGWSTTGLTSSTFQNNTYTGIWSSNFANIGRQDFIGINGHKMLVMVNITSTNAPDYFYVYFAATISTWEGATRLTRVGTTDWYYALKTLTADSAAIKLRFGSSSVDLGTITVKNFNCFDLTKMFGSGYELSKEEFKARYPLDYYAYNAGTLINNAASGIKTIGFNRWDEQWELGQYDLNTGSPVPATTQIMSKSNTPIRVVPNTAYCFTIGSQRISQILWYDANDNFISKVSNSSDRVFVTTSPENAYYLRFQCPTAYGTVYNNDICINLSWSGYRNGEYEPYQENLVYFDSAWGASGSLATIKGKKLVNGVPAGDSVEVFPDGMKSVGSVYDEIKCNVAIKRIYALNLGTQTYERVAGSQDTTVYNFRSVGADIPNCITSSADSVADIQCVIYTPDYTNNIYRGQSSNMTIGITNNGVRIRNDNYTDKDAFKSAMSGVMLYYVLATPETYLLDNPLPRCYAENKLGTEERLPKDTASSVNAPLKYTVKYPMNIAKNYVSADSISNLLTELATKFGAAMSKTITITPTFNENTQEFDYSITIT